MPFDQYYTITPEERSAMRKAAQEERERIVQEAINNGATVQYMTTRIPMSEWETIIRYGNDGLCILDSTIPRDITKCLKSGWKVTGLTYLKDTDQLIGATFEGRNKNISIRSVKHEVNESDPEDK